MNKLLYILPLAAAVVLTSCGKDDENNTPAGAPAGGMTAKVDGVQWTSPATTSSVMTGFSFMLSGSQMQGTSTSQSIMITVDADSMGTYTGQAVNASYSITNLSDFSTQTWESPNDTTSNATITITKWDETNSKASGTFSFTATGVQGATGTKAITAGSFNDVEIQ